MNEILCHIGTVDFSHLEAAAEQYIALAGNTSSVDVVALLGAPVDSAANVSLEFEYSETTRSLHSVRTALEKLRQRNADPDMYYGVCRRIIKETASYVNQYPPGAESCICIIMHDSLFGASLPLDAFMRQLGEMVLECDITTPQPESEPVTPFHCEYDYESHAAVLYLATGYSNPRLWSKFKPRSA